MRLHPASWGRNLAGCGTASAWLINGEHDREPRRQDSCGATPGSNCRRSACIRVWTNTLTDETFTSQRLGEEPGTDHGLELAQVFGTFPYALLHGNRPKA